MPPRVAYFPDSFHEINGVAHTSRNFLAYAKHRQLPFLCVRAGTRQQAVEQSGSVRTLELPRSAAAVGVEKDLAFDPLFWRHAELIERELHAFRPDILHLTGPSELGIFAAWFACKCKIPLAASWHTNVHQYAARRLAWLTRRMPFNIGNTTEVSVEAGSFGIATRFYALAQVLFAPNPDLCASLSAATGRPCHLMQRGVDTGLFSPAHRTRQPYDQCFTLGYVGRLSVEKNVALLPLIARDLAAAGVHARFLLVGHGSEEQTLRRAMPDAVFAGVLRGGALARAYAGMDLFIFPSHTDTFGNVVLEALASGVPAIVTPHGGPSHIISAETGVVAADSDFSTAAAAILRDPERLATMRRAARSRAATCSWDAVFDRVYAAYRELLDAPRAP